jgi:hypothetical protein
MDSQFINTSRKQTYCIYLEMNLFMRPPVIEMQGRMELMARANRQLLEYAKMKPVKNAAMKLMAMATFSDMP